MKTYGQYVKDESDRFGLGGGIFAGLVVMLCSLGGIAFVEITAAIDMYWSAVSAMRAERRPVGSRIMRVSVAVILCLIPLSLVAAESKTGSGGPNPASRSVVYHDADIIPLALQTGFTTLILLPKEEVILEAQNGDKDNLGVGWTGNLAYVKPGKAGMRTNVNLITAAGNVYSFIVTDMTGTSGHADLKVFVAPSDGSAIQAMKEKPRFVPAEAVEVYRKAAEDAKSQLHSETEALRKQIDAEKAHTEAVKDAARSAMAEVKDAARSAIPETIKHEYVWDRDGKTARTFGVKAIFTDGTFSYIEVDPRTEAAAIYEVRDGKPSLIEYQLKDGTYVIPKILGDGYMKIGKTMLTFHRQS